MGKWYLDLGRKWLQGEVPRPTRCVMIFFSFSVFIKFALTGIVAESIRGRPKNRNNLHDNRCHYWPKTVGHPAIYGLVSTPKTKRKPWAPHTTT